MGHKWKSLPSAEHTHCTVSTHCVDSCQQELSDAAQDLSDCHLITEQQVCEVRSLQVLVQVHLFL